MHHNNLINNITDNGEIIYKPTEAFYDNLVKGNSGTIISETADIYSNVFLNNIGWFCTILFIKFQFKIKNKNFIFQKL